jgi:hypothetical protein
MTLRGLALRFNVRTRPHPVAFEPVQTPAHTLALNLTPLPLNCAPLVSLYIFQKPVERRSLQDKLPPQL